MSETLLPTLKLDFAQEWLDITFLKESSCGLLEINFLIKDTFLKFTLALNVRYLAWSFVAIILGMTIAYYTGWPVIAWFIGLPCGIVSALIFYLIDGLFLKHISHQTWFLPLRIICMLAISIVVLGLSWVLK